MSPITVHAHTAPPRFTQTGFILLLLFSIGCFSSFYTLSNWAEREALTFRDSPRFFATQSHVVPPANAEYIYQTLPGADKQLVWLENSYQVATLDNDKDLHSAEGHRLHSRSFAAGDLKWLPGLSCVRFPAGREHLRHDQRSLARSYAAPLAWRGQLRSQGDLALSADQ